MAIDAIIRSIEHIDTGLTLHLEPRYDRCAGHFQLRGQPRLTIIQPTWIPEPGMPVWGGDARVQIGPPPAHQYRREHYTVLREAPEHAHFCPTCRQARPCTGTGCPDGPRECANCSNCRGW